MELTGDIDADRLVLLELSGKDVLNACSTSKYSQIICGEDFWAKKLMIDYDINLYPYGISNSSKFEEIYKKLTLNPKQSLFYTATIFGFLSMMRALLNEGRVVDKDIIKSLEYAAINGKVDIFNLIEPYLDTIKNISRERLYSSVLKLAARNCQIESVLWILDNSHPANYDSLSSSVVKNGCLKLVKVLVKNKVDATIFLPYAIQNGDLDIIRWLVKQGAQFTKNGGYYTEAAKANHIDVIQYLWDIGVSIKHFSEEPVQYSACRGDYEMTKLLLDLGANPNKYGLWEDNGIYGSPVYCAVINNDLNMLKLLYEFDARIDDPIIIRAVKENGNKRIIDWFNSKFLN